jgi:hypothetical protein
MLTFLQFLTEKFLMGTSGRYGYCEVYKNAKVDDLEKVGERTQPPYKYEKYGTSCYYSAAWITDKDFIVFDRKTNHHNDIKNDYAVTKKTGDLSDAIPVYVYWFPSSQTLVLALSSYSAHSEAEDEAKLKRTRKTHPFLKRWTNFVIGRKE